MFAPIALAQSTPQGTRGRPDVVQRELQRRLESEAIEQAMAARPRGRGNNDGRLVLAQIKEDFLQVQVVNDELRNSAQPGSLNFKVISKSAAEITRRAERLKENLMLPKVERESGPAPSKAELEIAQLNLSILALHKAIGNFVENPVFEKLGVVDAKLSARASRDLEQIILVSKQVKKNSEELGRDKSSRP